MAYFDDIKNVTNLQLPWEKLTNCNILVTGASGLIGSCLVSTLMERGNADYHVYAAGRNISRMNNLFRKFLNASNFHVIISDITEPLQLDIPMHYIIHAASGASPSEFSDHPVEVMKANIFGISSLMEYGLSHNMRRLLYISSGEVYGEGDGRIFSENFSGYVDPTSPRSCYPSSKRAAETLCVSYASEYGADVVIARPCHTYGPYFTESDNRVYAQFIRNVLNNEDILLKSSGEQFRSWCYVVDCVSALLYILLKGLTGEAYNIADGASNVTIKNLAEMIAEIGNRDVKIILPDNKEVGSFNPVKRSVFSTRKIEKLGWKVSGSMKEKMRTTVETLKKFKN